MGRRKQMLFVQGHSLAEEVDSDDEQSGGLHIGNVVVLRAPKSSSARTSSGLPRRGSRGSQAARGGATGNAAGRATHSNAHYKELQEEVLVTDSDASLDDELKDYLDNVKQADGDDSDVEDASDEQHRTDAADARTAAAAAAAGGGGGRISRGSSWEDWDDSSSSRPGLGFHSAAAAARFADVSLNRALEGMLARDLTQSGVDDSDSSSSGSSDYDSDTSSSDGTEAAAAAAAGQCVPLDIATLDNTTALVVDAAGQAMAVWEQLPLQHRFPVRTRQQQQQHSSNLQDARHIGSSSKKKRKSKKDGKDRRTPSRTNSGGQGFNSPAAAGLMPLHMPSFACDATTAAVRAAYSAAAAAADLESEQRQQQRKQQKSVVKGANRGQLLPGEKKKLRKEKIAAKRAVRQGERGQGALALLAAVEDFALSGSDMTMLPPCGKHKQAFTRSVAALFGIKASAQGGSSSGTTSLVLTSTGSTAPLDADSALQLQRLLVAELTREMVAAAIAEGPSAVARQGGTAGQRGGKADNRRSPSQGLQRQRSSRGTAALEDSVFRQPVAFVSAGALDPNSSSTQHAQQQQQQPYSIKAEAEQAFLQQGEAAAAVPAVVGVASTDAAAATAASFVQSLFLDDDIKQQGPEDSKQPDAQQQQQQQQQQPAEPAWVVDKRPWADVQQHVGLGFAGSSVVAQEAAALGASSVAAGAPGCTLAAVAAAEAPAAPLYDRPAMNLGLGFGESTVGLGFVQQQKEGAGDAEDLNMESTAAAAAAAAELEQEAQQLGTLESPGADSCSDGKRRLQELEDKFAALQAAANPAAARRQQRRQLQQRQRQQRAEARLSAPNTALGPVISAAAAAAAAATVGLRVAGSDEDGDVGAAGAAGVITLGLTKQQVKKAKKQQQRNARREARAAAAAEGDAEAMAAAAAGAAGNVSGGFAGFEAHTRGIGSRLMAGWGWREGEGLGRARQGRPEPLQAIRRARNQGLGAE